MVFYTIMVIIGNILRSQNPEWIILSLHPVFPPPKPIPVALYSGCLSPHTFVETLPHSPELNFYFILLAQFNFTILLRLPAQVEL